MKRTLVGLLLAGLYATASAQGYAGALVGMSEFGYGCKGLTPCETDGKAGKIYGGMRFKNGLVDAGRFKVDTIEVGFMRFQGVKAFTGNREENLGIDMSTGEFIIVTLPQHAISSANAITVAGVGRFEITKWLSASAKLGVAHVNSTVKRTSNGASIGSKTTSQYNYYGGVGIEVSVLNNLRLVGNYDHTKFNSDGFTGDLKLYGVGAEFSF